MAVLGFGVAVNDRAKNSKTGEWEDYPNFIDCTMFGSRAESLSRYLAKGAKVSIEGKLRYSSWEKDGQKRSKIEVIVEELEFMSARQEQAPQYQPQQPYQPQYAPQNAPQQAYAPQYQQGYQQPYAQQAYQPSVAQQVADNAAKVAGQPPLYDQDIPF